MTTPERKRLPARRPTTIEDVTVNGIPMTVTIGYDPATAAPLEVFLNGGKEGSAFDATVSDAAVLISVALQHGLAPESLAHSIARIPGGPAEVPFCHGTTSTPASPIGAALDVVARCQSLTAHEAQND